MKQKMNTITIRKNDVGKFDVLINDFSYRVNRNLNEDDALKRAIEIKNEFAKLKQRSIIEMPPWLNGMTEE